MPRYNNFVQRNRHLGQTGLDVTRLGLGLAALGRPGYMTLGRAEDLPAERTVEALEARSHAVLDAAYQHGIRYFDAARSYGRAEAFLRAWLDRRGFDPGDVVVASKWGYTYTAEWQIDAATHEVKEHSLPRLQQQWELSRQQLWDYLDLYQIHSATLESGVLDDDAVLEALGGLKATYGVRIGLSLSGPRQGETLRRAMGVRDGDHPLFDVVQATWNPLEPSAGPALAEAREAGMGVIVKEAVANGRLTARGQDNLQPDAWAALVEAAARHDVGIDAWAMASALAQPWVDVVLSGAVTETQLASNVRAVTVRWTDRDDETLRVLAEAPDAYWSFRKRLAWG